MRLYLLHERKHKQDPHFFDYKCLAEEEWRELLSKAKDEAGIDFDTENDDAVTQRTISLPQPEGAVSKPCFHCELRKVGGDWQVPIVYFRCQLVKGWAKGLSRYDNPFFCFVPTKADGNNLVKAGKGWSAADNQGSRKSEIKQADERKCWAALKRHLEKITRKWRD